MVDVVMGDIVVGGIAFGDTVAKLVGIHIVAGGIVVIVLVKKIACRYLGVVTRKIVKLTLPWRVS